MIHSSTLVGIQAMPVAVEVDITMNSLPKWHTVGLPDSEVRESKERVIAAIKNSGYHFDYRKVTINLAPANTRKEGTCLDLPMALGLMAASKVFPVESLEGIICVGELSLDGKIRPVRGVLSTALMARQRGLGPLIIPKKNALEVSAIAGVKAYAVEHLTEVVEYLAGRRPLEFLPPAQPVVHVPNQQADFSDIKGQLAAKRVLEIACAGLHNVLFVGPPGSGKTMLASRLHGILPPLTYEESLETTQIYSLMKGQTGLMTERPFRRPHHSISDGGLIGGGSIPRPGEVSLAHNGVLFLDELPEFKRNVLELLRQPLEEGQVILTRVAASLKFPARFMLLAAMNPCPCGYLGHPTKACSCPPHLISSYQAKISGPLLDRIDLQISIPSLSFQEITSVNNQPSQSEPMRHRVMQAHQIQAQRYQNNNQRNAQLSTRELEKYCRLNDQSKNLMKQMMESKHLSARAYHRILKVARSIADLAGKPDILEEHLLEALQYRLSDGLH